MSQFKKIDARDVPRGNRKGSAKNRDWLDGLADAFKEIAVGEAIETSIEGRYSNKGDGWIVSIRRAMGVRGIPNDAFRAFRLSRPFAREGVQIIYLIRLR